MSLTCITLHMPWAYWVLMGWKTVESRTHQRFACLKGRSIGIHASLSWDPKAMRLAKDYLTSERLQATRSINPEKYYGRILCMAECYGFNLLDGADAPLAMLETKTKRWGNYLTLVKPFQPFIKARGYQGIWNYDIAA
jgi:hypothetical protein